MNSIEKSKLMKKSSGFTGERDAFIHSEMKNGETQQIVSGSIPGIVHACYVAIRRTSQLAPAFKLNDLINLLIAEYEFDQKKHFVLDPDLPDPFDIDFPNS